MTEVMRADSIQTPGGTGPAASLIAWAQAAKAANELALPLAQTMFVPKEYQGNPGDATAAILYGAEVGLSPLQALQGIYVISGKPAMYARTLMAVVLGAGHEVWTEESSAKKVVVCGRRRGSEHIETVTWTIERATKAGYTKNAKYSSEPESMLTARAQSELCRRLAPDAVLGMAYSVEELEDIDPAPAAGKRTVARKSKPEPADPTSGWNEPKALEPGRDLRKVDDVDLPPLPEEAVIGEIVEQPARLAPEPEPAPDRPGYITRPQLKMLHAMLGKAGMGDDRDAALAFYAEHGGGRRVESSKDLTRIEATRVIDALVAMTDDPEPGFGEPLDEP